ncbi:hypothetical protein FOZ61_006437 [Perkinsus olseni]|uniref:Uncharacterized protein n=1 Tax=Perkinsus olseni TaxID=32597 RepID=A0A7J6LD65_PEROL|nr:hypothetical protein FOZ61_006437 [Perkinsus olseni]
MSPPYGSVVPYGEPSWYRSDHDSPYYNQSHRDWRDRCRKFVESEIIPYVKEWEEAKKVPLDVYEKLYKAGLTPCVVGERGFDFADPSVAPKPKGYDVFHELILLDELSRCGSGGVVGGLVVGYSIGLTPVMNFARPSVRDRVVPACLRGEEFISLAVTEPQTGSDVASIRATAKLSADGKHYIVNGEKKWITNGIFSDYFTTAVRTGPEGMNGISVLLVPKGPGVTVRQMDCQGVWSSGTTFVEFNDVKVPVENLLGKENEGFKVIMFNFNHERWGFVVQAVRFSRLLYEISFKYAQKRKTFGKALIEHPVIRWKLAEMARQIEGAQGWMESLTHQMCTMPPKQAVLMLGGPLALCKAHCTKMFEYCAREASQIFGGNAYTRSGLGEVVERLYRDVRALAIPGGSEEIMLDLAGEEVIASIIVSGSYRNAVSSAIVSTFTSTGFARPLSWPLARILSEMAYLLVCVFYLRGDGGDPEKVGVLQLQRDGKSSLIYSLSRSCADGLTIAFELLERSTCEGKSLADIAMMSQEHPRPDHRLTVQPASVEIPPAEMAAGLTRSVDLSTSPGLESAAVRLLLRSGVEDLDDVGLEAVSWRHAHRHFVGEKSPDRSGMANLHDMLPVCDVSWEQLDGLEAGLRERKEKMAHIKSQILGAEEEQRGLKDEVEKLSRTPVCLTELDVDCILGGADGFNAIRATNCRWMSAAESLMARCYEIHPWRPRKWAFSLRMLVARCLGNRLSLSGQPEDFKACFLELEEAGRQVGLEIEALEHKLEPIGDLRREDCLSALMEEYAALSQVYHVEPEIDGEDAQEKIRRRNGDILSLSLRLKRLQRERSAREEAGRAVDRRCSDFDQTVGQLRDEGEKRGQYEHTLPPEDDFPEYADERQQHIPGALEPPEPVVEPLEYLSQDSLPKFTEDQLRESRMRRIPYAEVREAVMLERAEEAEVTKIIGAEIRAKCRPEIDEYVDCVTDRYLSLLQCKPIAWKMRRCVKKYETSDFVANRMRELMAEREEAGTSITKRNELSKANKCFIPKEYSEADHRL